MFSRSVCEKYNFRTSTVFAGAALAESTIIALKYLIGCNDTALFKHALDIFNSASLHLRTTGDFRSWKSLAASLDWKSIGVDFRTIAEYNGRAFTHDFPEIIRALKLCIRHAAWYRARLASTSTLAPTSQFGVVLI